MAAGGAYDVTREGDEMRLKLVAAAGDDERIVVWKVVEVRDAVAMLLGSGVALICRSDGDGRRPICAFCSAAS